MTEYQKQALDFLESCNAKMEIDFIGVDINQNWNDDSKRNKYRFTITTPRGKMVGDFWDSIHNTQITLMTVEEFIKKQGWRFPSYYASSTMSKKLKEFKSTAVPTPYDILACLQKYDVGTMHDFFHEFGYEVKSVDDMFCFMNTYNAVVKEYRDLCRIFTEEQMERLREIQ